LLESSVTGTLPEQIENENDDDDEKDCSEVRAMLKVVALPRPTTSALKIFLQSND
jgi:hypothetical protein